jgi:hypothetical protein
VYVREAKKFSKLLGGEIWIKIHLNPKAVFQAFYSEYRGSSRIRTQHLIGYYYWPAMERIVAVLKR